MQLCNQKKKKQYRFSRSTKTDGIIQHFKNNIDSPAGVSARSMAVHRVMIVFPEMCATDTLHWPCAQNILIFHDLIKHNIIIM